MNNNMLWMHNAAREGRPSAFTLNSLAARYKGARFRVHEELVRLHSGPRTIFKPVIEVVIDNRWVTYMWLDHEELELYETHVHKHSASF